MIQLMDLFICQNQIYVKNKSFFLLYYSGELKLKYEKTA
jgi:hypothetical protein